MGYAVKRTTHEHYLRQELGALMREESDILEFLDGAVLDGLWYWNLEHPQDEWMSPRFWQVLGYDPEEMPHKAAAWQDLMFPDDLELAAENFLAHCCDPEHPYDQLVRFRHADSSTVWVRCRGLAIRDASGVAIRMLGTHVDVSDLMRSRQLLQRKTRELEASNRRLHEFSQHVAHDLRSPLGTLSMALSGIEQEAGPNPGPGFNEALEIMQTAFRNMRSILDGLLEFARSDAIEPNWSAVNLEQLLLELRLELSAESDLADIHTEPTPLPTIVSDPLLLRLILQNLLGNALKFCDPERELRIHILCEESDDAWQIRVCDNGVGISPDDFDSIFQPLARLHQPRPVPGSGLGLAICRQASKALGGHVRVESQPGHGSTFLLELPKRQMPEAQRSPADIVPSVSGPGQYAN